jgi:hypothetical protein
MLKKIFQVEAKVWLYPGMAAWHFVTIPSEVTKEIDYFYAQLKKGFGSLPVKVQMGETSWETSIFPDKRTASYLLPLKSTVRKKEKIKVGETILFSLEVRK